MTKSTYTNEEISDRIRKVIGLRCNLGKTHNVRLENVAQIVRSLKYNLSDYYSNNKQLPYEILKVLQPNPTQFQYANDIVEAAIFSSDLIPRYESAVERKRSLLSKTKTKKEVTNKQKSISRKIISFKDLKGNELSVYAYGGGNISEGYNKLCTYENGKLWHNISDVGPFDDETLTHFAEHLEEVIDIEKLGDNLEALVTSHGEFE